MSHTLLCLFEDSMHLGDVQLDAQHTPERQHWLAFDVLMQVVQLW